MRAMSRRLTLPPRLGWLVGSGAIVWLAAAASAAAHGPVPAEPPSAATLLLGWTFEPLPTLGIAVAAVWWWWAVRRVNAAHPTNPVPVRRSVAFAAGLAALAFALAVGQSIGTTRRCSRCTWSSTCCSRWSPRR